MMYDLVDSSTPIHCPYCNGQMVREYEEDVYWFECNTCGSRSPRNYGDNGLVYKAITRYIPVKVAHWESLKGYGIKCSNCKGRARSSDRKTHKYCAFCGYKMITKGD